MSRQRFSSRTPADLSPGPWARRVTERRARGASLIDLTEANPTRVELEVDAQPITPAVFGREYRPDPRGELAARESIARYYGDRGASVDPAHVVLTSGTSESYAHLFRMLADPGDTVLVPRPGYPLFEPIANAEAVRVRSYRIAFDGHWHLDLASLEGGDRVRAIVLVQPNHPTGTCLAVDELAAVEDFCERSGAAIIADEVFGDFRWAPRATGEATLPGFATLAGAMRTPTYVVSGLSKVCGLPQVKGGWITVAGPPSERAGARDRLEWLADLFLSVSAPTQAGFPEWLANRSHYQQRVHARIAENQRTLVRWLAEFAEVSWWAGQGGWVAILRLPGPRRDEDWALELLERDVLVHPGHFFDIDFDPVVVISLIVPPGAFARGLTCLGDLIRAPESRVRATFPPTGDHVL